MTSVAFGYNFFAPTILYTYTAGAIHTQLLSVPPWAVGFVASLAIAAISDRLQHRFLFATLPQLIAIAGFVILLTVHENASVRYAAMFLVVLGMFIPYPIIVCWVAMNVFDAAERGIVLGWVIGIGNAGGIPAVYLYLGKYVDTFDPRYKMAFMKTYVR